MPGSTTNSASPEKICSSALTTSTWMVGVAMFSLSSRVTCSVFAFSNASSIVPTM